MSSPKPLSIVLSSGGMDSCVTAAIASQGASLAMLHLTYGQRTQAKERECFERLSDHFGATHRRVVDLTYLGAIGGSSLTDRSIEVTRADPSRLFSPVKDEIPTSYVPFRNATFLSIATSWAEVLGAGEIYIGAVEEDSSGYPDCRREFYDAYQRVIELGTRPGSGIRIITPVIHMSKAEIVRTGTRFKAPFELTWSCYAREDVACGECESCALRLRAFREAGVKDPIRYSEQSGRR